MKIGGCLFGVEGSVELELNNEDLPEINGIVFSYNIRKRGYKCTIMKNNKTALGLKQDFIPLFFSNKISNNCIILNKFSVEFIISRPKFPQTQISQEIVRQKRGGFPLIIFMLI